MENDCNLTIIKNKEDLENYRKTLESAKSSLSILMIPYLMCKVNYTGLSNILKGEMISLFKLLNFYKINLGFDAFILVYKKIMDELYEDKIPNMEKLLSEGWYITVNELGGYTPRKYGEEIKTI